MTDKLFPLVAQFEDARIAFMTYEHGDLIFQIASGDEPAEEIRFRRGRGYLALHDRSLDVYALTAPMIELESELDAELVVT